MLKPYLIANMKQIRTADREPNHQNVAFRIFNHQVE